MRWMSCSTPSALYGCNGIMTFHQPQILISIFNTRFHCFMNYNFFATPTFLTVSHYLLTPSSILSCDCATCNVFLLLGRWTQVGPPAGSSGDSEDCVIGSQGLCVPTQKSYSSSETLKAFDQHQDQTRWATTSCTSRCSDSLLMSFHLAEEKEEEQRESGREGEGKGEESQGSRGRRYGRRNSVRSL